MASTGVDNVILQKPTALRVLKPRVFEVSLSHYYACFYGIPSFIIGRSSKHGKAIRPSIPMSKRYIANADVLSRLMDSLPFCMTINTGRGENHGHLEPSALYRT